ncbi:flavocytochrome c [Biscogniauxia mediterranea]|nr:flavocytochrome c [Biscogniauxia mediterranea]
MPRLYPRGTLRIYFIIGLVIAVLCMVSYHRSIASTIALSFGSLGKTASSLFSTTTASSPFRMSAAKKKPVIVVGSGFAGLSAAYEALKAGARVHMLERAAKPGGNSIKASSGINGAGTRFQRSAGIAKDESFYDDTVRSAGERLQAGPAGVDRTALIETLTARSAAAVDWLVDEIGLDLSVVAMLGGHSVARTHRGASGPPPGAAIVSTLLKKLNENPDYELTTSANVDALLSTPDGAVTGVRYTITTEGKGEEQHQQKTTTHELSGPVVFAAGGFAGDAHGLLARHRPDLAGMPSTNEARPAPHGLLANDALGVALVDMQSVQVHPTGFVDPATAGAAYKILAAEALRGEGGILLHAATGARFVDELQTRDVVSAAIMGLPPAEDGRGDTRQWDVSLLLDPGACEAAASHLSFYLWKGLMRKVKVRDLPPAVVAAVDAYAAAVADGEDRAFGRRSFGRWRLPPGEANRDQEVCVGRVTPVVHFTMGGAAFDVRARVLARKRDGEALRPVPGLWAAGEITGGVHGANRLGGSSLLECAVFGRIAGREAAGSLDES